MKPLKTIIYIILSVLIIITMSGCELIPELQDKETLVSTIESEIPNAKLVDFQESEDGCSRVYTFDTGSFKFEYHDTYTYTSSIGIYNGENNSECNYFNSLLVHASKDIYELAERHKIKILDINDIVGIRECKEARQLVIAIEEPYVYRFYVSSSDQIDAMFDFLKECTHILDKHVPANGSRLCIDSDINISIRYYMPYKENVKDVDKADSIIDCLVPFSKEGFKNMNTYEQIASSSYEKAITNGYLKNQITFG